MNNHGTNRKLQNKTLVVCITIVALSFIVALVYMNERNIENQRQISEREMNAANRRSVLESIRNR